MGLDEREMVFCYQNCSELKIAEGWEFAKILRSLEQFIETVKGQNKFLISNKLGQLHCCVNGL